MLSDKDDGTGWTTATRSRRQGYREALAELADDRDPDHHVAPGRPVTRAGRRDRPHPPDHPRKHGLAPSGR
jgi:hypothetical protein